MSMPSVDSPVSLLGLPATDMDTTPVAGLTEQESRIAGWLAQRLFEQRAPSLLRGAYYDGLQRMQDLGIAIPPALNRIRTVVGWPGIGIDAIANRCKLEGFRFPGQTSTDDDVWSIWQANDLDSEAHLAHLDALIYGRSYIIVGPGDENTYGMPLITAESPLNMTALWDARTKKCTAAFQIYVSNDFGSDLYGTELCCLYLPNETITMSRQATIVASASVMAVNVNQLQVVDRNEHNLGFVPVIRMANRSRLSDRDGHSEITAAWMNNTDAACRTLLGMELAREFYAAPRRYILGASEDDFTKPDGTPAGAFETYMSKIWAVERDEDGNLPTVGEFHSNDPKVYTEIIDEYAQIMSGEMGVPPHFLGIYTEGNPASADAIRSGYEELTVRATNKQNAFGGAWEQAMLLALQLTGDPLPDQGWRMESDWADPSPSTPSATSQAITLQVQSGILPATSDVALKRLGYSPNERLQIAEERDKDMGQSFLAELAHSIVSKDARVDNNLAPDITGADDVPGTSKGTGPDGTPIPAPKPPAGAVTP